MKLRDVVIFVSGVVVGGLASAKIVSKKYDNIINEEIDSVKKTFKQSEIDIVKAYEDRLAKIDSEENQEPEEIVYTREEALDKASEIASKQGYASLEIDDPEIDRPVKKYVDDSDRPYSIPPFEVGELSGYRVASCVSYANGVITEGDEDVIYDIDEVIGEDNFVYVGDYEPGMLYIRNDKYKTDYVIYECDDDFNNGIIDPRARD